MKTKRGTSPHSYSKPGAVGGRLIREVIASFRSLAPQTEEFFLPLSAHILIGVSGGCDSMALAHLMIKYGRRVGAASKIRLVHINHGWRGKESDGDEAFVRLAAKRWKVPISVVRVKPIQSDTVDSQGSPEELARGQRKKVFDRLAKKYGSSSKTPAWILTAHHADDLAETLVWRFFTGTVRTHGAGIVFRHHQELRPFLSIRKRELAAFLKEEGESWREDRTNFEGRLMRSKMRLELMPIIECFFPRAVAHLVEMGLQAQKINPNGVQTDDSVSQVDPSILFSAAGLRPRRAHWEWLKGDNQSRKLMLPGGWVLHRDVERWILEKSVIRQKSGRKSAR